MKRALTAARETVVARLPDGVRQRLGPDARYVHMLAVDHMWVRLAFPNRHRLAEGVWRGAQPLPHHIRRLRSEGLRTIVNLRGPAKTSTYALENAACAECGVNLIDFAMKSRGAPSRAVLIAARDLFDRIEYPVLIHCKSGADRAGLMSALYLHLKMGVPVETARHQLSLRFGHIRQADTGILDAVFERYLMDTAARAMPFMEWVETVYDASELQRSYSAKRWANRITGGLLRRE